MNSEQLIFNWSPVESNCSALQYIIESDCGTFTTAVTTSTLATCSFDLSAIADSMCTFTIRSVVCGNISGILSDPLSITLKGTVYMWSLRYIYFHKLPSVPQSPVFSSVIPHYNSENKLIALDINFTEVVIFHVHVVQ